MFGVLRIVSMRELARRSMRRARCSRRSRIDLGGIEIRGERLPYRSRRRYRCGRRNNQTHRLRIDRRKRAYDSNAIVEDISMFEASEVKNLTLDGITLIANPRMQDEFCFGIVANRAVGTSGGGLARNAL